MNGTDQSGGIEPSAELRTAAHALREMYVALTAEGFTEAQTLQIIGYSIATGSGGGGGGK